MQLGWVKTQLARFNLYRPLLIQQSAIDQIEIHSARPDLIRLLSVQQPEFALWLRQFSKRPENKSPRHIYQSGFAGWGKGDIRGIEHISEQASRVQITPPMNYRVNCLESLQIFTNNLGMRLVRMYVRTSRNFNALAPQKYMYQPAVQVARHHTIGHGPRGDGFRDDVLDGVAASAGMVRGLGFHGKDWPGPPL
jgi:hypothetical protein